jgi:hypothetical protein
VLFEQIYVTQDFVIIASSKSNIYYYE